MIAVGAFTTLDVRPHLATASMRESGLMPRSPQLPSRGLPRSKSLVNETSEQLGADHEAAPLRVPRRGWSFGDDRIE